MKNFKASNLLSLSAVVINLIAVYNSLPPEVKSKVKSQVDGFVTQCKTGVDKASGVFRSEVETLRGELVELKSELEKHKAKFLADVEVVKSKLEEEKERAQEDLEARNLFNDLAEVLEKMRADLAASLKDAEAARAARADETDEAEDTPPTN